MTTTRSSSFKLSFSVIDLFEKVTDKDAALMTRELARKEGIFAGNSAGSALAGLIQLKDSLKEDDLVVVIFHDHGSRYMGKMYNEDWLRERGFLEDEKLNAKSILKRRGDLAMHTRSLQSDSYWIYLAPPVFGEKELLRFPMDPCG